MAQQQGTNISEAELASDLTLLAEICKNAVDGDKQALDHLKLQDGINVKTHYQLKRPRPQYQGLKASGDAPCLQYVQAQSCPVAPGLQDEHTKVPSELIPSTLAQTMHDLCMETSASLERIRSLAREGEVDTEREPKEKPLPHRPIAVFRVYMSDVELEEEEEESPSASKRKVDEEYIHEEEDHNDHEEDHDGGVVDSASKPLEEEKKDQDGEESAPAALANEETAAAKEEPDADSGYAGKNKVHARPNCEFRGTHLDRHLMAQHPEVMSQKEVSCLVAVSHRKLQKHGTVLAPKPKEGQYLYQCGYLDCTKIVTHMSKIEQRVPITIGGAQLKMKTNSILSVISSRRSKVEQVVNYQIKKNTKDDDTSPPGKEPPAEKSKVDNWLEHKQIDMQNLQLF